MKSLKDKKKALAKAIKKSERQINRIEELKKRRWYVVPCNTDTNRFLIDNNFVAIEDGDVIDCQGHRILGYLLPDGFDQLQVIVKNWEKLGLDLKVFHQKEIGAKFVRTKRFLYLERTGNY